MTLLPVKAKNASTIPNMWHPWTDVALTVEDVRLARWSVKVFIATFRMTRSWQKPRTQLVKARPKVDSGRVPDISGIWWWNQNFHDFKIFCICIVCIVCIVCTYTLIYTYTYICRYKYKYKYIYIYLFTDTYTHTHTFFFSTCQVRVVRFCPACLPSPPPPPPPPPPGLSCKL